MKLRFRMKDFRFGKVQVWFDCGFRVFLRYARAMNDFGVSLRLRMLVY